MNAESLSNPAPGPDVSSGRVFRRALAHWNAGEYHLCLSLLEDIPPAQQSSESVLLGARALLRVGRHVEAEQRLADGLLLHRGIDPLATHHLLLGVARARADDYAAADRAFAAVRERKPHRSILAETCYEEAMARYQSGQFGAARAALAGALRPVEDIIYARARSLMGWIDTATGDFAQAYEEFAGALVALAACQARDAYLQASLVYALAILCAEVELGDPGRLDEEVAKIRWTSSMAKSHSQALRHIGLAFQRRGDAATAAQRYVAAAEAAEGTAWSIIGYAECANVAFASGESISAGAFASKAIHLADRIESAGGWAEIADEQRIALLVLAQVLARMGAGNDALRYHRMYGQGRGVASTSALRHDRRLETYEAHVAALVDGALGADTSAALREIAERWNRIGYRARATEALEDALRLSGATHAQPHARIQPPATVSELPGAARSGLSVRDEQILRMVARGFSDDEIARQFHISPRTARNIVNNLYAKFGVHSRAQLVVAVTSAR